MVGRGLDESEESRYMQGLAQVIADESPNRFFQMGQAPDVLCMVGMQDVRVSIHGDVLYKAMADFLHLPKRSNKNRHNIDPEAMRQIPAQMNDPVAVFATRNPRTQERAFAMLTSLSETDLFTQKEKPLLVALHLETTHYGERVADVKSVHGRRPSQIQTDLDWNLLYWHTEKGQQLSEIFGLQLSSVISAQADLSERHFMTEHDLRQYVKGEIPAPLPLKLPDISRLCPRDIGKQVYELINGDLNRLDAVIAALEKKGYSFDAARLNGVPDHPATMKEAFGRAIRLLPQHLQHAPKQERSR